MAHFAVVRTTFRDHCPVVIVNYLSPIIVFPVTIESENDSTITVFKHRWKFSKIHLLCHLKEKLTNLKTLLQVFSISLKMKLCLTNSLLLSSFLKQSSRTFVRACLILKHNNFSSFFLHEKRVLYMFPCNPLLYKDISLWEDKKK